MLALGYKMSIIERFCFEYDWGNVRSVDPDGAFEFLETYGVDDGTNLEKLIHKILYHKGFGPNTTFGDLQSSGRVKSIRLWASDIQNMRPVEFSATATPDFSVTLALRASMCIPLYFIPIKHPETQPDEVGFFTVKVPKSGSTVKLKLLTLLETTELNKMEKEYPSAMTAPTITWKLNKQIVELDGSSDRLIITRFVDSMPIADSKFIRKFLKDNQPSLDLTKKVKTPSGEVVTANVTFGVEFFRPFF
jgi:hypothetical protein